jgi:hypothetical protein
MGVDAQADYVSQATIAVTIIRADGTVEEIGVVDTYYRSRVKRLWWKLYGKPRAERRIAAANRSARSRETQA